SCRRARPGRPGDRAGHRPPRQVPGRGRARHGTPPAAAHASGRPARAAGTRRGAGQRSQDRPGLYPQPPPEGSRMMGVSTAADRIDGLRLTRLDNGLIVATDAMAGIETAAVGVWVGAGTRHEPAAINGVAHLLEHMAFKGTQRRNAREISVEIESVGGHLNAYTSRENTAYYARVLADDVPLALDIVADILQHSVFDESELARERTVVLQEIGQAEDTPDDIIFDHFQARAYPDQALGRPVLGTAEI